MRDAYFVRRGDHFEPTGEARGSWSSDSIHGIAVCGLLGHAAEQAVRAHGRDDLVPARFAVDLFAPPRFTDCTVTTSVVRDGPRLFLLDVHLSQGETPVARASATFVRASQRTDGDVWEPATRAVPPPTDVAPESDEAGVPFIRSGDGAWSNDFREHQVGLQHTVWQVANPVVQGSPATAFEAAAAYTDGVNMTTNWGSQGVQYINTDATLCLSRLPVGVEIGLHALDRTEHDGIAVGAATMFDRQGQFGVVTCAAIANSRRSVDMTSLEEAEVGQANRA